MCVTVNSRPLQGIFTMYLTVFYYLFQLMYIYGLSEGTRNPQDYNSFFIYDERNSTDCSWQYNDSNGLQTQDCRIESFEEARGETDQCGLIGIEETNDVNERPKEVQDLRIEEISKTILDFEGRPSGEYTCLNITFTIERGFASRTDGIRFSIRSLNDANDRYRCEVYEFHDKGTHGMNYYSVVHTCGTQSTQCVKKIFVYDSFCGIIPGFEYEMEVRTLPVDMDNDVNNFDTKVIRRYPDNVNNASDDCSNKPNDMRCIESKEANWTSEIQVQQEKSINLQDNSVNISVTFSIAPRDYEINEYGIFFYKLKYDGTERIQHPYIEDKTFTPDDDDDEDSHIDFNVNLEYPSGKDHICFKVKIQPRPRDSCTQGIEERPLRACPETWSRKCCSYGRDNFTCTCDEGHVFYKHSCYKNPCLDEDNNSICGEHSNCNIVNGDALTHNCTCHNGYQNRNGTCVKDIQTTQAVNTITDNLNASTANSNETVTNKPIPDNYSSLMAAVLGSLLGICLLGCMMFCFLKHIGKIPFKIFCYEEPSEAKKEVQNQDLNNWFDSTLSKNADNVDSSSIASGFSNSFDYINGVRNGSIDNGMQNVENKHIQQAHNPLPSYGYPTETSYDSGLPLSTSSMSSDHPPIVYFNYHTCADRQSDRHYDNTEPRTMLHSQDMHIHSNVLHNIPGSNDSYSDLFIQTTDVAMEA